MLKIEYSWFLTVIFSHHEVSLEEVVEAGVVRGGVEPPVGVLKD